MVNKNDICCFVESKTDDLDEISVPGYKFEMKNRKKVSKVKSGGIVLAYRENFKNNIETIHTDSKFILWCKISNLICKHEEILLGVVYIPPEYTSYSSTDAINEIENEYMKLAEKFDKVLLLGDFNARTAEESDFYVFNENENGEFTDLINVNDLYSLEMANFPEKRKSRDKMKNRFGNQLLDFCKGNNLFIMNGRSKSDKEGKLTCRNASVVDYCISNSTFLQYLSDFQVMDFSCLYSDVHSPLIVTIYGADAPVNYTSPSFRVIPRKKINKWNKDKAPEYNDNIETAEVNNLISKINDIDPENLTQNILNSILEKIGNIYLNSAKKTFGTKPPRENNKNTFHANAARTTHKPWFDLECKNKQNIYRKLSRNKHKSTFHNNLAKTAEKEYKKTLMKAQARYKRELKEKMKLLRKHDTKEYWKILNKGTSNKQPEIDFETLVDFFKNLNKAENSETENFDITNNVNPEVHDTLNGPITADEILKCTRNLKNDKACSNDQIINEYIKSTIDSFIVLYEKLFNLVFKSGKIPDTWLEGTIIPFYKNKGDKFDPKNYRPITIVSCLGKLFTSILNCRLNKFSEETQLLKENQCGFRKGYSTVDCIFTLHSFFEILKSKRKKLFCAFVDFEKAFDKVCRSALWYKMTLSSVTGYMYNIIYNMYQNIKSCISYNGAISDYFPCENGVRQGENLSPFLFSLFLNDLEDFLCQENITGLSSIRTEFENRLNTYLKLFIILYADDTVIMAESANDLQLALDKFHDYCNTWKLKVNVQKTKIVIFSKGRLQRNVQFIYDNTEVEIVKEFNYLGIYLSRTGSFRSGKKYIVQKATNAMYNVLRKGRKQNMSIECQLDLFSKLVKPILLYGCEVWGFENNDILERVQLKFFKLLLGLKQTTPSSVIYGELGLYPLNVDIKVRMISYWAKILMGNHNKLCYYVYKLMLNMAVENREISQWMNHLHNILNECGLAYIWTNQFFPSEQWIKLTVKTILQDQYKQTWHSNVFDCPKTINYRIFKTDHAFENYFNVLEERDMLVFCKFRMINHKLPIESGRWKNIPRENRICTLCNVNAIGDEYHYIMECQYFVEERREYIDRRFLKNSNTLKFNELMNLRQKSKLKKLCSFIKIINKKVNSLD